MSSGHTHNRNGRGNQRRKHGPPRPQPQNNQPQNGQPQNGQAQQPRDERNTNSTRPALSMTTLPARTETPFQAPDDPSPGNNGPFMIVESVAREITEVTLESEVQPTAGPERTPPASSRPLQQRNTQPPGKRGPFLVSSERRNGADSGGRSNGHNSQHGAQHPTDPRGHAGAPDVQPVSAEPFVVTEPTAPSGLPRSRRAEHDAPHPNAYVMQHGAADDDDEDADYIAHERRPLRDVRGDVGTLIDSLHDLFTQDRGIASQGHATRCGICYLHYPLPELEYREVEGYYICADCKRALGSTHLMMLRRQQKS